MKDTDRKAFVEIVLGFAELRGRVLSAPALELYWRAMRNWELSDFRAAAEHLLKTFDFMPTPKQFEDLLKAGRSTPGEAWARAVSYAASGEYRRTPTCGDPLTDACVEMLGGYSVIGACDVSKLHWIEKRFCEHFEAKQDAQETRSALPQLTLQPEVRSRLEHSRRRLTQ